MNPPPSARVEAVLSVLRREKSYETVAAECSVTLAEVHRWETDFIAAGASALHLMHSPLFGEDVSVQERLSEISSLNAMSQSLSAILNISELVRTALDYLYWVFHYIPMIALVDGEDLIIKGGYALDGKSINWYDWRMPISPERSILGWVASHGRPLNVLDVADDHRYVYQEIIGKVGSELAIPMIFKGVVLGVLDVKHAEPYAFEAHDMHLLETIAFQIAVSIENAKLFETVRRRIAHTELIQNITANAMESNIESTIIFAVQALHNIENYTGVAIGLLNTDQQSLTLHTLDGPTRNGQLPQTLHVPVNDTTVIGSVIQLGQVFIANEVQADQRFTLNPLLLTSQSQLVVPIRTKDGVIGIINVENEQPNAFDPTDTGTLTLLADELAVAIRSAQLLDGIQQANARFQAILDSSEDGIIVWDEQWRVLFVNPSASEMLGLPAQTLIGVQRNAPNTPPLLNQIGNVIQSEQIEFLGSKRIIGQCRNLQWSANQAHGYLSVINDITSQIDLEAIRQEMTSTLVHDLRGPLGSMVGAIDFAMHSIRENEEQEMILNVLSISYRSATHLLDMTNSLLDISRLESGTMQLDRTAIDAALLINDALEVFSSAAQLANITIHQHIDKSLPSIKADAGLLRRVIQNLLDNAIKFTPDGGEVTISVNPQNTHTLQFSVADTGPGVPEAFRRRIFGKYAQVPGQKARRRGTGLGLAFCRLVTEAHGGKIWLESPSSGGSIFSFTIVDG